MPKLPMDICCGCSACYSICPKSAIQMTPNEEGFSFPEVNENLCVECSLCEKSCPVINHLRVSDTYIDAAIAQSTEEDVLCECTSGGFIDALYKYILTQKKGYAAGVTFDDNFLTKHIITDSYDTAKQFRNSKYSQSDMGDVFCNISKLLNENEQVLFVGTPCQVAGLLKFLQKDYSNLYTVDLVCRSVPSPKLWREYLSWQETRHKAKVKSVSCRKKTYGYHSGALEIEFTNGKQYKGSNRVDYYMKAFHSNICSRPSCYDCKFKTKHRTSDLTVFDCWNPELVALTSVVDNDRGFSNVIAHTKKGAELLKSVSDTKLFSADAEKMFMFTGSMESKSIEYPDARSTFYKTLNQSGFTECMRKYVKVTFVDRLIESIKPIVYGIKHHKR